MSCKTNGDGMKIHFGLLNGGNKYLTAESFGFKVNASGTSMKKKQIWTMEQEAEDGGAVFFKSHLGRYLAADRNGNISCDAEERDDGDCRFVVQAQADGKWAIQSQTHGRYLGGSEDRLSCFAQSMGPGELWSVHLAMHPQVNLFHVGRKRYAQLLEDELAVNADVPWGVTSLVTLDFHERRYLLKTSDNRLLLGDGSLVREPSSEALFTLEFVGGKVAFRDCQGRFLSAVGPRGSVKSSKAVGKAGKNEVFELQESRPQVVLRASNGRNVSTKQSTELSANQDEETEHETFQMEMEQDSQRFAFRTFSGKYWVLGPGGIQASVSQPNKDSWFDMEWHGRQVALKAPNGKYVAPRKNGQLAAQGDIAGEENYGADEDIAMGDVLWRKLKC
uniref:fascin-like n=1 Tax=Myxine glutinosa TaxID=7769 RepID=UPI00358FC22F